MRKRRTPRASAADLGIGFVGIDIPAAAVLCFVVAPAMRGTGGSADRF